MIQYSYIDIWSYILNDLNLLMIANSPNICYVCIFEGLSFVSVWVNTRTASDRLSFHPSLQHNITSVQRAVSQPAGLDVWTHTPAVTPRQPRGGGERFLSPHTHTHERPGSPCTGVKGPRSVGCQNTTLINVDVSLDDVSLLLKNRGEIKRNEGVRLYLLRFRRYALMNMSLSEHTYTSSSR